MTKKKFKPKPFNEKDFRASVKAAHDKTSNDNVETRIEKLRISLDCDMKNAAKGLLTAIEKDVDTLTKIDIQYEIELEELGDKYLNLQTKSQTLVDALTYALERPRAGARQLLKDALAEWKKNNEKE